MVQVETVTQSSDNFASDAKPAPNASTTLQDGGAVQTPNLASTLPGSLDQVSLNTSLHLTVGYNIHFNARVGSWISS